VSILGVTGAVLLTAAAAGRRFGPRTGWRAGWILATSILAVTLAHAFTADATLLLGVSASFWAWARLREGPEPAAPWQALFWLGVAWGALAKLVNVLFLAAAGAAKVYAAHAWSARARRTLAALLVAGMLAVSVPGLGALGPLLIGGLFAFFALVHWRERDTGDPGPDLGARWGVPAVAVLFLAWAIPALVATEGAFFTLGIQGDLIGRSTSTFEGHWGFPGYYALTMFGTFFPWSLLVPAAFASARAGLARDPRLRFLACWIVGPWLLLELATTKLPHYVLVLYPALAVFVAQETERRAAGAVMRRDALRRFEVALPLVLCALAVAAVPAAFWLSDDAGVRGAAAFVAAVGAIVGVVWVRFLARREGDPFARLALGAAALWLAIFGVLAPAVDALRLATPIAEAVARQLRPDDRLLLNGIRYESIAYESPRVPEIERDYRRLAQALGDPRTLLIVPEHKLARAMAEFPARYEVVESVEGRLLERLDPQTIWLVRGVAPDAPQERRAPGAPHGAREPGPR
jgi:4-amino-4-deoxy-L-arabinose transferase-like glycosyltransferase